MRYQPLDTGRNEISLLTLLRDKESSDMNNVNCTLDHASLLFPQRCFALCYYWGDLLNTSDILPNNSSPVQVTVNLKAALLRLKKLERKGFGSCVSISRRTERRAIKFSRWEQFV